MSTKVFFTKILQKCYEQKFFTEAVDKNCKQNLKKKNLSKSFVNKRFLESCMHKLITKMLAAVVNNRFNDIMLKKDAYKN